MAIAREGIFKLLGLVVGTLAVFGGIVIGVMTFGTPWYAARFGVAVIGTAWGFIFIGYGLGWSTRFSRAAPPPDENGG